MDGNGTLTSLADLAALYPPPHARSVLKQLDHGDAHCRAFIAASPFVLLATCGPDGADCSPRGDAPGFVQVPDDHTLLLPDRPGNNRVDSLKNIVQNPAVGLLFLVPGVKETFRVNGRATLSTAPDLLAGFAVDGKLPRLVIQVTVQEAFIQCSRALMRAHLWDPATFALRAALPTMGQVLATATAGEVDAAAYDAELPGRLATSLY